MAIANGMSSDDRATRGEEVPTGVGRATSSDGHATTAPSSAWTAPTRRARHVRASRFQLTLLLWTITFGVLAYLARSTPYWGFDLTITRAIQSVDVYGFGTVLNAVSWIGFPPQFAILCALIVVAMFLLRRAPEAWMLMLTSAGAAAIWFASTRLIDRPRPSPDLVRVGIEVHGGSFPSGHVLTNVAIFGFIVFLAYTRLRPSWPRTLLMLLFGLPILVVGVARVYAGHHWPSDVVAGYMVGGMWLAIVIHIYRGRVRADDGAGGPGSETRADTAHAVAATGRSWEQGVPTG